MFFPLLAAAARLVTNGHLQDRECRPAWSGLAAMHQRRTPRHFGRGSHHCAIGNERLSRRSAISRMHLCTAARRDTRYSIRHSERPAIWGPAWKL